MNLMRERLKVRVSKERENDLWARLCEQFQPLVVDVALQIRRVLDLPPALVSPGGELFLTGQSDLLYYWISEDRRSIEVGAVYNEASPDQAFDEFRQTVGEALGSDRWQQLTNQAERFQPLLEESEAFPNFEGDIEPARAMAPPANRHLLAEVSRRSGAPLEQVTSNKFEANWDQVAEQLESCQLIQREFQVYCRDTGIQLCKFPSKNALDEAARMGFRSFSSGRPIMEERIIQFLFSTDLGRRLSKRNLWLALCLADALKQMGVERKHLRWTVEKDYRTINLFSAYRDSAILFEIQEEAVTADMAFRFLSRARYYRPDAAFLVTPLSLRPDARQLIDAYRPEGGMRVRTLHDLSLLAKELERVQSQTMDRSVEDLLQRFGGLTWVNVGNCVGEHLLGPEPEPASVQESSESLPEEPEILEAVSEAAETVTPAGQDILDLDLDLDLEELGLGTTPVAPQTGSSSLDDFDLELDLDNLDLSPARPSATKAAPAKGSSMDPLDDLFQDMPELGNFSQKEEPVAAVVEPEPPTVEPEPEPEPWPWNPNPNPNPNP